MHALPKPYYQLNSKAFFLDVEASGLDKERSYPIQIAVVDDALSARHDFLIKPMPHWTAYWSDEAESIHGISRERLEAEGIPAEEAASRLMKLGAVQVCVDDGAEMDKRWVNRLFSDCGMQKPFVLRDFRIIKNGGDTLAVQLDEGGLDRLVAKVFKHTHSAVADATQLAARWRIREDAEFRQLVKAAAARLEAEDTEEEVPAFRM